jgi:hypothetical protein
MRRVDTRSVPVKSFYCPSFLDHVNSDNFECLFPNFPRRKTTRCCIQDGMFRLMCETCVKDDIPELAISKVLATSLPVVSRRPAIHNTMSWHSLPLP